MITVTQKGLRVDYTNHEGQSSSIRVTEDVGALFAAAPDLLKALEDVLRYLQNNRPATGGDGGIIDTIKRAIKKANEPT